MHIISGLLHNPEVIFMDEPLNGLDANAVIIVKEVIALLGERGENDLLLLTFDGCGGENSQSGDFD